MQWHTPKVHSICMFQDQALHLNWSPCTTIHVFPDPGIQPKSIQSEVEEYALWVHVYYSHMAVAYSCSDMHPRCIHLYVSKASFELKLVPLQNHSRPPDPGIQPKSSKSKVEEYALLVHVYYSQMAVAYSCSGIHPRCIQYVCFKIKLCT